MKPRIILLALVSSAACYLATPALARISMGSGGVSSEGIVTSTVAAPDADGRCLQDDGGNVGLCVNDGGAVTVSGASTTLTTGDLRLVSGDLISALNGTFAIKHGAAGTTNLLSITNAEAVTYAGAINSSHLFDSQRTAAGAVVTISPELNAANAGSTDALYIEFDDNPGQNVGAQNAIRAGTVNQGDTFVLTSSGNIIMQGTMTVQGGSAAVYSLETSTGIKIGTGGCLQFGDASVQCVAAMLNLVDDVTPQLGGDLDVNGFAIDGASNFSSSMTVSSSTRITGDLHVTGNSETNGNLISVSAGTFALKHGADGTTNLLSITNTETVTYAGQINSEHVFDTQRTEAGAVVTISPELNAANAGSTDALYIEFDDNPGQNVGAQNAIRAGTVNQGDTFVLTSSGNIIMQGTMAVQGGSAAVYSLETSTGIKIGTGGCLQFGDASVQCVAAMLNLVDDVTPQLGGDLDVNGFAIDGASNFSSSMTVSSSTRITGDLHVTGNSETNGNLISVSAGTFALKHGADGTTNLLSITNTETVTYAGQINSEHVFDTQRTEAGAVVTISPELNAANAGSTDALYIEFDDNPGQNVGAQNAIRAGTVNQGDTFVLTSSGNIIMQGTMTVQGGSAAVYSLETSTGIKIGTGGCLQFGDASVQCVAAGMSNLVEDITPQFGGPVDFNEFAVTSTVTFSSMTYTVGNIIGHSSMSAILLEHQTGVKSTGGGLNNVVGNARAACATDLQVYRAAATQVASGICTVLGGGENNTVAGVEASVLEI